MTNWDWVSEEAKKSTGNCPRGIHTSAADLARFGQLYIQKGSWNNEQVLSESFVEEATTVQVPASTPCTAKSCWAGRYGYFWYVNAEDGNGRREWPAAPSSTFWARGDRRQYLIVIPSWNTVIARIDPAKDVPKGAWNKFFQTLREAF